jgi:hypothetical protein
MLGEFSPEYDGGSPPSAWSHLWAHLRRTADRGAYPWGALLLPWAVVVQLLLQEPTWFEYDPAFGWDTDLCQSPGVLCGSGWADLGFEGSEVAEFETVASGELGNDLIEELLDHGLDQCLGSAGSFGDTID